MRKLKLESLQVESFVTAPPTWKRGTVDAHATPPTATTATISPGACGHTNYLDCTYGCSHLSNCIRTCIEADGVPDPEALTI